MKTTSQLVEQFSQETYPGFVMCDYTINGNDMILSGHYNMGDYLSGATKETSLMEYWTWMFNTLSEKL